MTQKKSDQRHGMFIIGWRSIRGPTFFLLAEGLSLDSEIRHGMFIMPWRSICPWRLIHGTEILSIVR